MKLTAFEISLVGTKASAMLKPDWMKEPVPTPKRTVYPYTLEIEVLGLTVSSLNVSLQNAFEKFGGSSLTHQTCTSEH